MLYTQQVCFNMFRGFCFPQPGCWGSRAEVTKASVNMWLTDNCQCSMGWIKMEQREESTLTCWHVLLSAFQGGFNLFAPLWSDTTDTNAKRGRPFEREQVNFTPTVWRMGVPTARLHSRGEWDCCGSPGSGVSESSLLNQTNTVEFVLLLERRAEWQGCRAGPAVRGDTSGSKWDHPFTRGFILKLNLFRQTAADQLRWSSALTRFVSLDLSQSITKARKCHFFFFGVWIKCILQHILRQMLVFISFI